MGITQNTSDRMPQVFLECLNRVLRDAQCRAWLRLLIEKHELPVISMTTHRVRGRKR